MSHDKISLNLVNFQYSKRKLKVGMAEVEKPVTLGSGRAVPDSAATGASESKLATVDDIGIDKIRSLAEQGHTKSQFK